MRRQPLVTVEEAREALRKVMDPELGRDIVALGMVRNLSLEDAKVELTLALTTLDCPLKDKIVARPGKRCSLWMVLKR